MNKAIQKSSGKPENVKSDQEIVSDLLRRLKKAKRENNIVALKAVIGEVREFYKDDLIKD